MRRTFRVEWEGAEWDMPADEVGHAGYELVTHTCSDLHEDFPLVNRLLRTCGGTLRTLPDVLHRRFPWAHTHLDKPPLELY